MTGMGGVLGWGMSHTSVSASDAVVAGRSLPHGMPGMDFLEMELRSESSIRSVFKHGKPSHVLHAASWSNLRKCEESPKECRAVVVEGTRILLEEAMKAQARVVFVSTDQVFSGEQEGYEETATPQPLHVYGQVKVEAEQLVLDAGGLVARIPLLLGPRVSSTGVGADCALLEALATPANRPCLFDDEIRAPAGARAIADGLYRLLERSEELSGVFHFAGATSMSRWELGHHICEFHGVAPDFDRSAARQAKGPRRPLRLTLQCSRALKELGWKPPDLPQCLADSGLEHHDFER